MLLLLWGAALAAAAALFFYCGPHSRFRGTGVKYLTPVPLLGDMGRVVFQMLHWHENMTRIYNRFPGERFFGACEFVKPVIVIRDPELAKSVSIKDFEHFGDHVVPSDGNADDVYSKGVFSLKGQEWKDMRSKLTPLYSSSKLRAMTPYMAEAGNNMIKKLNICIKDSGKDFFDLDMRDICSRHATDVYAASAYGLKIDSLNSQDAEFYEMSKSLVQLGLKELLKFLGFLTVPSLMKKLNITWLLKESTDFFCKLFMETLRNRELQAIDRPDMIGLIVQSRKESSLHEKNKVCEASDIGRQTTKDSKVERKTIKKVWSDLDFLAQAVGFLIAGVEEVASPMAFLVHMLALHPDVQEKLVTEINDIKNNGGKVDYDSIQQMTYLNMVISEVLRLWASSVVIRVCTKDYNLGKPNENATKDYIIRKGESIRIYTRAMHLDPEYFPEPRRFDPERFSPENRHKIRPGTFNPFGMGPRSCIGYIFALMQLKLMICMLLQHIEVSPCEKTSTDIQLSTAYMIPAAEGGHWVRVQVRN